MELLLMLSLSFGVAFAVGITSVLFQHGSEKVHESKAGKKIGEWILLLPIIILIENMAHSTFDGIYRIKKELSAHDLIQSFVLPLVGVVVILVGIVAIAYAIYFLIALAFNNIFELAIILGVVVFVWLVKR